jgi:hypothetical protein
MKGLTAVIVVLPATMGLVSSVRAHHSQAMFDSSKEIIVEGTVARFDWVNPHMYLIVATEGPNGERVLVEGEGLAITQALVDGLRREALQPGTPVVMRANPNRGGAGKQVRILDVTTEDGEIHPFYAGATRTRTLTPAASIAGHWAPSTPALGAAFGAMARWPVTPAGRAAQAEMAADGLCYVEPTPFLSVLNELRTIDIGDDEIVMRFDNSGDPAVRTIHMDAEHPAGVAPSLQGHSIGRWEGSTLVIDTIAFEPNASGIAMNVPSSPGKHTVERLSLTEDRLRLRYEITVEDPVYLSAPATLTQQWDHRPDLEFSPAAEGCDPDAAARYREHVPR